jgi:hypothetical protein
MINYMLFYIIMNLENFTCIVLFDLCTTIDNIQDPFLALFSPISFIPRRSPSTSRFFLVKNSIDFGVDGRHAYVFWFQ